MPLARIQFGRARKGDFDQADDAAHGYLAALLKNGQIHEYFLSSARGRFQASAEVPRHDSLDRRHSPSSAAEDLKKLIVLFGREPEVTLLDRRPPRRPPGWRRARSFYLFTSLLDRGSPVHSPELDEPAPLYLLPLKPAERESIVFWAEACRAHHRIWIGCGPLEMRVYRELADPRSDLARWGREQCARIEKATGKPTYYYLMRYFSTDPARRAGPVRSAAAGGRSGAWMNPKGVSAISSSVASDAGWCRESAFRSRELAAPGSGTSGVYSPTPGDSAGGRAPRHGSFRKRVSPPACSA